MRKLGYALSCVILLLLFFWTASYVQLQIMLGRIQQSVYNASTRSGNPYKPQVVWKFSNQNKNLGLLSEQCSIRVTSPRISDSLSPWLNALLLAPWAQITHAGVNGGDQGTISLLCQCKSLRSVDFRGMNGNCFIPQSLLDDALEELILDQSVVFDCRSVPSSPIVLQRLSLCEYTLNKDLIETLKHAELKHLFIRNLKQSNQNELKLILQNSKYLKALFLSGQSFDDPVLCSISSISCLEQFYFLTEGLVTARMLNCLTSAPNLSQAFIYANCIDYEDPQISHAIHLFHVKSGGRLYSETDLFMYPI